MKKVLLFLLFVSVSITLLKAQKKYEITITGISVNNKGPIDSVHIGDKVTINIHLQNDGAFPVINSQYQPDSFPGGAYYFHYNVSRGSANEKNIAFSHTIKLNGMAYKGNEQVTDTITITESFYKCDSNNFVIVWPSGGKAIGGVDSLDTIPKATYNFYVYSCTAGIIPQSGQNFFKIYPNPAKDVVNIEMKQTGTGVIRLMDMAGKLVASKSYSARAGENISLPLNEGATIPDGIYIISIETSNSSEVSKIMICR